MRSLTVPGAPLGAGRSGHSDSPDACTAGREAVRRALAGYRPTADDVVLLFASADRDVPALVAAAEDEAAPARLVGCTSTGGFTEAEQVPSGCVAALLQAQERTFGVCHVQRDDEDIAGCTRRAVSVARQRAGEPGPHSVLVLLVDGLTPDLREVARGAYEVTTAVVPFGGGSADDLHWERTYTYGDGRLLTDGILAIWINSSNPVGVSVDHGWRPAGRPMLVTRAAGTVVHELDGMPAIDVFLAEQGEGLEATDPEFFHKVMHSPVGCPNGRGRYDVRQLHAYLPEGGGINFNAGISEQSVLQVMSADRDALLVGARNASADAVAILDRSPSLILAFSCGSRTPLLGDRAAEEAQALAAGAGGAAVCGFFTYGEFARTNGSSGFHNSSVAVLAL